MTFSFILVLLIFATITGLGLLIYLIVAKKYGHTAIWLIPLLGLTVLAVPMIEFVLFFLGVRSVVVPRVTRIEEDRGFSLTHERLTQESGLTVLTDSENSMIVRENSSGIEHVAEETDDHSTKYKYDPSKPLTADIYPSLDLCGRPLAFQLANDIRNSSEFSSKTAFTFQIIKDPADDDTPRQITDGVKGDFTAELSEQFPKSKYVFIDEVSAEDTNQDPNKLDIRLSHTIRTSSKANQPSGSVKADWIINDKTKGKISVNYVEKQWVKSVSDLGGDPKYFGFTYQPSHNTEGISLAVGFTNRFARSPSEASKLSLQNAVDFCRHSHNSFPRRVIDSFKQKLSMPYGELWQEAVLVDFTPRAADTAALPVANHGHGHRPGHGPGHGHVHSDDTVSDVVVSHRSSSHRPTSLLLIILIAGTISIAWISNLLTQGYYRQTINYTLVTTIAVVAGLMILMLLLQIQI